MAYLIENIIGSTSKVKILRLFFEYPNRTFSTREILSNAKIGIGYGLKCLNLLSKNEIIKTKRIGKQKCYFLNKESKAFFVLEKLFEQERRSIPRVSYLHRAILAEIIEKLDKETVILFGSVAAGTATQDSDIDLLIISEREKDVRKIIKSVEEKNEVAIQPIILSNLKLMEMIRRKARIIKNISKEKLLLIGDEEIVEMIERV
ncbi:MAG: nucleotidyltransferase domain-containing protein [Candidatus Aenigmarchaeota archaeon]|nr:nucleotidyltransferase domain-containing protein [Candidatus Aenigmarchaeota archaeon]